MSKKHPLKSSLILLLVAVVAILVTFLVIKPHKESSDKNQENAQLLYPSLDRKQTIEVLIKSPDLELSLTRSAENADEWHLESGGQKHRADKNSVDGMLSSILASKKESEVNNVDAAQVGLSPARFSLQIPVGTPPKPRVLLLGDDTPVDYLVYAKWADEPAVFTTTRSLRFAVDKKVSDLRNKKMMSELKLDALNSLTITTAGKEGLEPQTLEFAYDNESKLWEVVKKPKIKVEVAELSKWVNDLAAASAKSFLSDNEKDKSKFGLNSAVATVKYTGKDGIETKWTLGTYTENKEKKWAMGSSASPTSFELTPTFVDNFKVDLFKFRDKKIASFDAKKVKQITISVPKLEPLEFKKSKNDWTLLRDGKELPVKKEQLETSLRTLTELRANAFFDTETPRALGFTQPQRVASLELEDASDPLIFVFGKSFEGGGEEIVVKTSQSSTPVRVEFDLEKHLSIDWSTYIDERAKPSSTTRAKGDLIKMEATVTNLKDLKQLPESIVKPGYEYSAKMVLQDGKEFEILFDADKAPYTVSNFLHLARNGFYNNVKFHRVIENFVAQGGDPTGTGAGGPGWKFKDESNNLTHQRGVLSMANAGPNTNGSQFFVVLQPQSHLNGKHTVFGKITKGADRIDEIKVGDVMKSVEVFERSK